MRIKVRDFGYGENARAPATSWERPSQSLYGPHMQLRRALRD